MPEDGLRLDAASRTTTPPSSARTPGATSRSSSSTSRCSSTASGDGATVGRAALADESDVCKHCTHAACLDVCPTGALFRTEFGTVVVQEDICNGCGYCVPACPVRRDRQAPPAAALDRSAGRDPPAAARQEGGRPRLEVHALLRPAEGRPRAGVREGVPDRLDPVRRRSTSCASAPTQRLEKLQAEGWNGARLYGHDPDDGVGGFGAFFLLLDEPEVYGLPPDPVVTTRDLPRDVEARPRSQRPRSSSACVAAFLGGSADGRRERHEMLLLRPAGAQGAGLDSRRSRGTSSPAGSRARRRCSRSSRGSAATRRSRGRASTSARRRTSSARRCSISDLGRPERFLNMFRVFKVTSPMSVGAGCSASRAARRHGRAARGDSGG